MHAGAGSVGVNYGILGNNLPPPAQAAQLLLKTSLRSVKLYTPDQATLQALAHTNIKVVVGVGNNVIPQLASSTSAAQAWVQTNIAAYMPATLISAISVGNEVLTTDPTGVYSSQLVAAMTNVHSALVNLKLENQVLVSTSNSLSVLSKSFPPSAGTFNATLATPIKALLNFLYATSSFFMVNAYPYFAYSSNPRNISLAYALFQPNAGVTDLNTGLHYTNIFDAQLDAMFSAMERLGYPNVPIVVSETGWPSAGDPTEIGCSVANAQQYNGNLIKHVASNSGTPLRPSAAIDVFIFALFNEDLKPGPASERNFGLFNPDQSVVYNVGLLASNSGTGYGPTAAPPTPSSSSSSPSPPVTEAPYPPASPTPPTSPSSPSWSAVPSPPPPTSTPPAPVLTPPAPTTYPSPPPHPTAPVTTAPPAATTPSSPSTTPGQSQPVGKTWCVAKPGAAATDIQNALNFACGEGAADCSAIQPGGACFWPQTLMSHASYAYNSYYQKNGRNYWNCYFGNTGVITITDPSKCC
jgi:exo-beta-1,3-glucanase (GH17 family)